eukprot:CAMPEP_0201503990 /NCGR_PEP_ID=MMETSP0151_2-20130828/84960_1 /ASSEMBLY_ACC=CAM_ASM_000257 /TAXON_ID=200890 /ORGANISM="Paramoeba atlantica, Strain 621/1 / CCAP 1560/9" /LENGTH=633 /DNA_ID=CAMNT_0047897691 /DNA_START=1723 /DNA_END=3624 /DNA_ORIENTATION=-
MIIDSEPSAPSSSSSSSLSVPSKKKRKGKEGKEERKEEGFALALDEEMMDEVNQLDSDAVNTAYDLFRRSELERPLHNAFVAITGEIRYSSRSFSTGVELRALLILFRNPLLNDPGNHNEVLGPLLIGFSQLSKTLRSCAIAYFTSIKKGDFEEFLGNIQQFLTLRTYTHSHLALHSDDLVIAAVKVIALLFRANLQTKIVEPDAFYNEPISDRLCQKEELEKEFQIWRGKSHKEFCFCDFPFILTAYAKSKIVRRESKDKQRSARIEHIRNFMARGGMFPFLSMGGDRMVWRIRREYLLDDTLAELNRHEPADLRKELKVVFVGEEAIDEGGVQKELFMLITRQLFDPQYGMFLYNSETRTYWFNPSCQDWVELELIGKILGLAIYNGIILDLNFPAVLYRKLLGFPTSFSDLCDSFPSLGSGLKFLLTAEDPEPLGLTFEVMMDNFGTTGYVELKEGGADITVTKKNKDEFLELYTKYYLETSIARQFGYFSKGFRFVCDGPALRLFNVIELEELVCGSPHFDFDDLENGCIYQGYDHTSTTIRHFWDVVNSFSLEQKKKLLVFSTGSDRAPIGGLQNLNFVIVKHGDEDERLPQSHTCFNVLLLPDYSSKEVLRSRLISAIENSEGFGML